MNLATLAAWWLRFVVVGGALSTLTVALYARSLYLTRSDPLATEREREIAWHRLRAEVSRLGGWYLFLLLGLSAAGWTFNEGLWVGSFFGVMLFWVYATVRGLQMWFRYYLRPGQQGE